MKRREFITLLGGAAAAWPGVARAQTGMPRRVGVLMNASATDAMPQSFVTAFVQAMRQLGWVDGQNLRVDIRWNAGDAQLARIYAAQLIGLNPDVIVTASTTNLRKIIQQATGTVPVVFLQVSDPVEQGFVTSVAKPGGNITGFSMYELPIGGKWLDLLKEISPTLAHVGVVFNPDTSPQSAFFMRSIEAAASSLGVKAIRLPIRAIDDLEPAFENFARRPNGGLVLPTDAVNRPRTKLMADLTIRYRLPAIAATVGFARDGGLMSYTIANINLVEQFQQAATYVERIFKGAKPGDLPVQRADKYTFILNLKTAKALGIIVPLPLLGLADEVIE